MIDSSERDRVSSSHNLHDRNRSLQSLYIPPSNIPFPATCTTPDYPCTMCHTSPSDTILEPCHHLFHFVCLDSLQMKERLCPACCTPIKCMFDLILPERYTSCTNASQNSTTPTHHKIKPHPKIVSPTRKCIRKGKWTAEESAYCDRLIEEFKNGNLPLAEGTTLRAFLSKLLQCDPMRISKKYTGDQCIGKIVFRRRERSLSEEEMQMIREDLAKLEQTYLEREESNHRRREKRLEAESNRDWHHCMMRPTFSTDSNESEGVPCDDMEVGRPHSVANSIHGAPRTLLASKRSFHAITKSNDHQRSALSNRETLAIDDDAVTRKQEMNLEKHYSVPPTFPRNLVDTCHHPVLSIKPAEAQVSSLSKTCATEGCIPRIHSLDQLSYLVEEHIPQSPLSKREKRAPISRPQYSNSEESHQWEEFPTTLTQNSEPFRNLAGNFPRIPSLDTITWDSQSPRFKSDTNGVNRIPSLERLASLEKLCRVSSSDFLARIGSSDQFPSNSFPSCGSFGNLSSLASGNFMPRNSSIEDILSLIASSESGTVQVGSSSAAVCDPRASMLGLLPNASSEVSKRTGPRYSNSKYFEMDTNNEITAATLLSLDQKRNFDTKESTEKLNVAF